MVGLRTIIGGVGAVGAAGAMALTGVATQSDEAPSRAAAQRVSDFSICLKTSLPFFEGVEKGCYQKSDISDFQDRPVVDNDGNVVTYDLAHPTNHSAALLPCTTCREYREMNWMGWFAPSSREMRREAFFVRACGLLDVLADARQARETFFAADGLTKTGLATLSSNSVPQLNEAVAGIGVSYEIASAGDGRWLFTSETQTVLVQEIAYADFDADGIEDALVFVAAGPDEGSARIYDVAVMTKLSQDGPLTYVSKTIFNPA